MTEEKEMMGFAQLKRNGKLNGIQFDNNARTLWLAGEQIASGVLPEQDDRYRYFYELRFLDDFPQITHWAFGSAWTQQVMLKRPEQSDGDTLRGQIFFASEEDLGMYSIERSHDPLTRLAPIVNVPLPKLFSQALNLPLRIVLAQMVTQALDDELPYDQWQLVTSLLPRDNVVDVLTTDMVGTYGFRLKYLPLDLRQALCELQNISLGGK